MNLVVVIAGLLAGLVVASQRLRQRRLPAHASIISPQRSTVIARDGAVRSVQSAELTMTREDLDRRWSPANLENLARTYWRFLSRVTLGLIRVVYGQGERRVVLLARPFTLLRFDAPEYLWGSGHGKVIWRIRDGLLVARAGRGSGFLAIDVHRLPNPDDEGAADFVGEDAAVTSSRQNEAGREPGDEVVVRIDVEVANFYPAIAAGFSTPVYQATQSVIHVLVTHAFLRSLAKLDLAHTRVGVLQSDETPDGQP